MVITKWWFILILHVITLDGGNMNCDKLCINSDNCSDWDSSALGSFLSHNCISVFSLTQWATLSRSLEFYLCTTPSSLVFYRVVSNPLTLPKLWSSQLTENAGLCLGSSPWTAARQIPVGCTLGFHWTHLAYFTFSKESQSIILYISYLFINKIYLYISLLFEVGGLIPIPSWPEAEVQTL